MENHSLWIFAGARESFVPKSQFTYSFDGRSRSGSHKNLRTKVVSDNDSNAVLSSARRDFELHLLFTTFYFNRGFLADF